MSTFLHVLSNGVSKQNDRPEPDPRPCGDTPVTRSAPPRLLPAGDKGDLSLVGRWKIVQHGTKRLENIDLTAER